MNLSLNHFSIRTLDLDRTRHFYTEVLGFADGPRPPFPFPGAWLYAGSTADYANAVVHVIGLDPVFRRSPVKTRYTDVPGPQVVRRGSNHHRRLRRESG